MDAARNAGSRGFPAAAPAGFVFDGHDEHPEASRFVLKKSAPRARSLAYFDRGTPAGDVVAALRRDGAAVVREQVAAEAADAVLRELRPHFDEQGRASENDFNGYRTLRLSCVLSHAPSSAALIGHPLVIEVADAVLLDHCVNYQVGSTTAIEIWPDETGQVLHRDDSIYPLRLPGTELQISAMWALQDFNADNGATRLLLGSHTVRDDLHLRGEDACQALMPKGSVLFYMGRTIHGGGANRSNAPRAGLINTYSLGWLQPEVNHVLTLSRELVHSFPEPIPRLMGYQSHGRDLRLYPGDPDGTWIDDVARFELDQAAAGADRRSWKQDPGNGAKRVPVSSSAGGPVAGDPDLRESHR